MNKILFALLFASVSFCATQDASAVRAKPKEKEKQKIAGTSIRRGLRIDLAKIAQDAVREAEAVANYKRMMEEEAQRIEKQRMVMEKIKSLKKGEKGEKTPTRRLLWGKRDNQDQDSLFSL